MSEKSRSSESFRMSVWIPVVGMIGFIIGILPEFITSVLGHQYINWPNIFMSIFAAFTIFIFITALRLLFVITRSKDMSQEYSELIQHKILEIDASFKEIKNKADKIDTIVHNVQEIEKTTQNLHKQMTSVIEISRKLAKDYLMSPEEAARIEEKAQKEVYILAYDERLENEGYFKDIVCNNIIHGIKYYYFFSKSNNLIERNCKLLIQKFSQHENMTPESIEKNLNVYIVDSIHIMNYIVLVDPNTLKSEGWIFPIIDDSDLIIKANDTVINNATKQAQEWMKDPNVQKIA